MSRAAWTRPGRWLPPLVAFAALVGVWQVLADHDRYLLPRPGTTAAQLLGHPGLYLHDARATLVEALVGLAIGFASACLLSLVMSEVEVVERAVLPLAVVLNVTPVVALAPALVVAFGFGAAPKIIVTAVIVFFPALINALIGLRSADPAVLDVLRSLDAARREVLWHVRLPAALPYLFAAARVCLPLSVVGAVVAELVAPGSSAGLGTLISQSAANSQLPQVYAAILCLAALGVALTGLVVVAERRALAWQPARRAA